MCYDTPYVDAIHWDFHVIGIFTFHVMPSHLLTVSVSLVDSVHKNLNLKSKRHSIGILDCILNYIGAIGDQFVSWGQTS